MDSKQVTIRFPTPRRGLLLLVAIAAFILLFITPNVAIQTVNTPKSLATAITFEGQDVNVLVYDDKSVVEDIKYDETGHGDLPSWKATIPVIPGGIIPSAPRMGWDVSWFGKVAMGREPLRLCTVERKRFDDQYGDHTAIIGRSAVEQIFLPFTVTVVEDCVKPNIVLGTTAADDCRFPAALGCALLDYHDDGESFVRVTFNEDLRLNEQLPDRCITTIDWHEVKHSADLGHTGEYGGEGHHHDHNSDLGYIGRDCKPVDNPTDQPAIEDWLTADGHDFIWGLDLKPMPSTSPLPTPNPNPSPSPTPNFDEMFNVWFNRVFNLGYCAAIPENEGCR